jgi:TonB family protein
VIPVSARAPIFTPLKEIRVEPVERVRTERAQSSRSTSAPRPAVVEIASDNPKRITLGHSIPITQVIQDPMPYYSKIGGYDHVPSELIGPAGGRGPGVKPGPTRIISVLSEAQLLNRVEPVYPRIAIAAGVQGQVKLHAIIARDGRIMSLNVISGHPLLVRAAEDAVSQWRYRPYYLNGEAVEVETFVTVNFKKEGR